MKRNTALLLCLTAILMLNTSCGKSGRSAQSGQGMDDDTMCQVATLQSLMSGIYDGVVSIGEFKGFGDIGIGTFDHIDGELIMLDGIVYQARGNGEVIVAQDSVTLPFAVATHFDCDTTIDIAGASCLQEIADSLDAVVEARGKNLIYAVRIDLGRCDSVTYRSVLPQNRPYRPLAEVVAEDQRTFAVNDIGGTIVAVYFPDFFDKQNAVGWHFHFISEDRSKGGHLLDISSREAMRAQLDATPHFTLHLPDTGEFNATGLGADMTSDIQAVEK